MTVAGCTVPSASNTCVMPTFLPMIPVTICRSGSWGSGLGASCYRNQRAPSPQPLLVFFSECFDLDVDAGRKVELHQRVHRLRRRLEDVDQTLVRADLELLARFLVDVRRAQHGPLVLRRRQRDRPREPRPGALRGVDDLGRRLVEDAVVVRLEADSDLVAERAAGHICISVALGACGLGLAECSKPPAPSPDCHLPCMRATTSSLTF